MADQLKIGMGVYVVRGLPVSSDTMYVIIGLPKPGGQWVTVAPWNGGVVESMPKDVFEDRFYEYRVGD